MLKFFVVVLTFICSSLAFADYPEKSIRLVVPFATGGTSEIIARSVASSLSTSLGQSVYVDNKPGGAGNIAMEDILHCLTTANAPVILETPSEGVVADIALLNSSLN